MLKHKFFAPQDDVTGGGGGGADSGAGGEPAGERAGGAASTPTMEQTARNTYRALMAATGDEGEDAEAGDGGEPTSSKPAARQRGTDGRFAKPAGQQSTAQQPGGAAEEPSQQAGAGERPGQEQQQAPQQQPSAHEAYPNTWRKDLAGEWSKLPDAVRQEIHRREQDFHNGVRQYKEAAGFGASIAQEMLPYQPIMRQYNVAPQTLVRDIMASLKVMATGSEESKAQTFLQLAQQYGINFDTLQTLRQRAPAGAAPDLAPVLQRFEQLETRITQAEQEREQRQRDEDEARVQSFLNDPKNEHARAVSRDMAALLGSGQVADLQSAYDKAIWANPEVRAKLLQKQEAERRSKEAEEAAAARKAAGANVQRRGTPPAPGKHGTMEDTARAVYRKMIPG